MIDGVVLVFLARPRVFGAPVPIQLVGEKKAKGSHLLPHDRPVSDSNASALPHHTTSVTL